MLRKTRWMVVMLLGCVLSAGSVVPALAYDRDDRCEARVRKAEQNLDKAVRRHGEHSRQAEQKRRQLEEAKEKCRGDREHDRDHDRDRH